MSFFNFFRGIFGLPPEGRSNRPFDDPEERPNEFRKPIWSLNDDDDDEDFRTRPRNGFGFHIDSDPLEMHRFFEQQLNEMLQNFRSFGFGSFGFNSSGLPSLEAFPSITEENAPVQGSLRDEYLRPSFQRKATAREEMDSDIDDKIDPEGLGKLLAQYISPRKSTDLVDPNTIFSGRIGRSMTTWSKNLPNGGMQVHREIHDHQGNQEITVTRSIDGQSYSVTTKTFPDGREETIKSFVNMDEGNMAEFEKKWGSKL